jgi:NAD(P)-dependent dehydrogenase (short-subunit alcohol dehydrogenase family)
VTIGRQAGRVALVTGAARGIGRAFSEGLAGEGARLVLVDVDEPRLAAVAADIGGGGGEAVTVPADVTRPEDVDRMIGAAVERFGRLDVLVNNAGRFPIVPIEQITLEDWRAVVALNLEAVFLAIRAAAAPMRRQGYGRIVNVASVTVFTGPRGFAHYAAAKAGVIGLTRVAATELGPDGITVNVIVPGLTLSETVAGDPRLREMAEARVKVRAVPRHSRPEDLVPTLLYLAAPEADFITGQTVSVNGGEVKL